MKNRIPVSTREGIIDGNPTLLLELNQEVLILTKQGLNWYLKTTHTHDAVPYSKLKAGITTDGGTLNAADLFSILDVITRILRLIPKRVILQRAKEYFETLLM